MTRYNVEQVEMSRISAALTKKRVTSVQITEAYIERIKTFDHFFNSVIQIAPDALERAAASDRRRSSDKALGPLDGVPILVKDNIDVEGMATTAGSYALMQNFPTRDAELVRRLRAVGAIILGKTNLCQFSGFRTTMTFNGSTVGGAVRNPYDLARTPGGSSSGSVVAAATSFAAGAIGTETSGSIVEPASMSGLVGLKPTVGLISRRGIVPISANQDTAGPITRSVADAALIINAIAGSDTADSWSKDADAHKDDLTKALDPTALQNTRIGVIYDVNSLTPETTPLLEAAVKVMTAQDAIIVHIPESGIINLCHELRHFILTYQFSEDLNAYLAGTPAAVKTRSMLDLIAFNKEEPHENVHGQDLFEESVAMKGGRKNSEYVRMLDYVTNASRADGIDRLIRDYNLAALVTVTTVPAGKTKMDGTPPAESPLTDASQSRMPGSMVAYAAIAGYPHLTVPMGMVNGMPVGLSFVGPAWSDRRLLSLGYSYEQASHMRKPPLIPPSWPDQL